MSLRIRNGQFVDETGRTVLLRGVSLGGNCKYPASPYGATHIRTDFSGHREVSYVGHPFPLAEADVHFRRLRHWGFNALRFLVSWEGLEHAGPGQYDEDYLDFLERVLALATEHGFTSILDCHQDVWSRMSGGDGAPGWIFEKVGLDVARFDACEAALVMQHRYDPSHPETYPPMYWAGNNIRFASATMWTLFFGGRDFAPSCVIDGMNVQDYLQSHLIGAVKEVARRVRDNAGVLGFSCINEPPQGWIELKLDGSNNKSLNETLGHAFTPFDAMATAAGHPRVVGYREVKRFGIKETRKDELNPRRISCWLPGREDIWQKEGIWGLGPDGRPVILKNDTFVTRHGRQVDFVRDYLSPAIANFALEVRAVKPHAVIFCEGPPERTLKGEPPSFQFPPTLENLAFAPHWYDVATLGTKKPMLWASFDMMTNRPVVGPGSVSEMFVRQLKTIRDMGKEIQGGVPTVLAEFGLPFDMKNKEAYAKVGTDGEKAWENHVKCLGLYYDAIDANRLHSLQWNYTPNNTNEHGDGWNLEDLSIFSLSQATDPSDPNSGGRAIHGFCRPHYASCAGTPVQMEFDSEKGVFHFEFDADSSVGAPTVIYVPRIHFPKGYSVELSAGKHEADEEKQLLLISSSTTGRVAVTVTKKK